MRNRREFIKVFGGVTGVAAGAYLRAAGLRRRPRRLRRALQRRGAKCAWPASG